MMLLDGRAVRDREVPELRRAIRELGFTPTLGIVFVGAAERSRAYITQKEKFAEIIGAQVELVSIPADASTDDVLHEVQRLNSDSSTNGIIVQLPLPREFDRRIILESIEPEKDVDGLTAHNLKRLMENDPSGFVPATARGVMELLAMYDIPVEGRRAVVVGRSLLVGKPLALALLNANATVTICHRHTQDLASVTREADILVVGAGKPHLITRAHVRPGQVVVDVGISVAGGDRLDEEIGGIRLVGDVDAKGVSDIVGALSPVPGGTGPMTVLALFENLIAAAQRQSRV